MSLSRSHKGIEPDQFIEKAILKFPNWPDIIHPSHKDITVPG